MPNIVELSASANFATPVFEDSGPCGSNGRSFSINNNSVHVLQVVYQEECVTDATKTKIHYRTIDPREIFEVGCSRVGGDAYQFKLFWALSNADYIPRDIEDVYQNLVITVDPSGTKRILNPNATRFAWVFAQINNTKANFMLGTIKDLTPNPPIWELGKSGFVESAQWPL